MTLNKTDSKILMLLQQDARITNQVLADKVGISASPCWRKVRRLEKDQVIQGYRAVVDRKKIGLNVMVFVRVLLDKHGESDLKQFEEEIGTTEEVILCYSIGVGEFLLQVLVPNLDTYDEFTMKTIRRLPFIREMQSMYVLKEVKPSGIYPVL
ncbi:Leucine-responsive regulatory protein [Vibrio aerogenes CECT 7868]|uniref:Leucine-responsive regulatory protein n=1 Tax=Vibrio aerogenes CECT 7868 TaxID=1216006 RepID=A0A1M5UWH3_9VIBR|nr:Lrp/AsnC family transcriptional regulator [Vibrio aerogenes]SHH67377.1 Leucine-responsive regulatory protein [Vibrio aerogenes CECT 7868]